jgi:hypothetical protein
MYLIIKQTDFNNLDPMYTVEDQVWQVLKKKARDMS